MKPAHSLTEPGSNGPAELGGSAEYSDAYYHSVTQQLLAHALNRKGRPGGSTTTRCLRFERSSAQQRREIIVGRRSFRALSGVRPSA